MQRAALRLPVWKIDDHTRRHHFIVSGSRFIEGGDIAHQKLNTARKRPSFVFNALARMGNHLRDVIDAAYRNFSFACIAGGSIAIGTANVQYPVPILQSAADFLDLQFDHEDIGPRRARFGLMLDGLIGPETPYLLRIELGFHSDGTTGR